MRKRPTRPCPLCRETAVLCDSHLIPAAAYKPLRATTSRNPNPLILSHDDAYTSSRQFVDYLLCPGCEQRFREHGEDWILAHSYRGPGEFLLRDILLRYPATFDDGDGITIYDTTAIHELDMDKVVYFGASVFWRAAVHEWRRGKRVIGFDFGKYLEPLRLFLYAGTPFPDGMVLRVWISSLQDGLCAVAHAPEHNRRHGIHVYQFAIPGMSFELTIGSHIPMNEQMYSTSGPQRFVGIAKRADTRDVLDMADRWAKQRARQA